MKLNAIFLIFAILKCQVSLAQTIDRDPSRLVTGSGYINTRNIQPELVGKTLLFNDYKNAWVILNKGIYKKYLSINYDIESNTIVVQYNQLEFELKKELVDTLFFEDLNATFVQGHVLTGIANDRLYQVLHSGTYFTLIKGFYLKIKKPDYNELFNIGSRDYIISRDDKFFLKHQDESYMEFKARKSDFVKLDSSKEFKSEIKKANLSDDNEVVHLIQLLERRNR